MLCIAQTLKPKQVPCVILSMAYNQCVTQVQKVFRNRNRNLGTGLILPKPACFVIPNAVGGKDSDSIQGLHANARLGCQIGFTGSLGASAYCTGVPWHCIAVLSATPALPRNNTTLSCPMQLHQSRLCVTSRDTSQIVGSILSSIWPHISIGFTISPGHQDCGT